MHGKHMPALDTCAAPPHGYAHILAGQQRPAWLCDFGQHTRAEEQLTPARGTICLASLTNRPKAYQ